jgi:hypothetical protein
MDEIWCRPGKTGIVILLVGLHWQALYSGAGKKWVSNIERVATIFDAILGVPSLYVALIHHLQSYILIVNLGNAPNTEERKAVGRRRSPPESALGTSYKSLF